jgi:hypothetical protein
MTPYPYFPDYAEVRGNEFFWRCIPEGRHNDPTYLFSGQTDWFGPVPPDYDDGFCLRHHHNNAMCYARSAARDGVHVLVQTVGQYIRTHRLREGPAKKLSDWKELPPGVPMLLNPCSTPYDAEKALNRAKYMQTKGFGRFRSSTDANGALWVGRL